VTGARQVLGVYCRRLIHELGSDEQRFRRYFRMSTSLFYELAERLAVETCHEYLCSHVTVDTL